MKRLSADRVIIARGVLSDPRSRARLDAMLPHVDAPRVDVLDDGEVERALVELGPREGRARGGLEGRGRSKALVAFARFPEDGEVFPGYSWREVRDGRAQRDEHGVLCQTAVEIQSVVGCPFDCAYCPYTSFVCARLDVEVFADRVERLVRSRPSQTVWKLNNRSDTLGLEPEYGLAAALIERFARLGGPTLMLYSKGEEVRHLADLDHRGRTVGAFTITPARIAEVLERGAPPPDARLAALGAMHRAGYPTRVRFSPIVPLAGWRDDYVELVARLARVGTPELITLWTLSMVPFSELSRILPLDALDPALLEEARDAEPRMRDDKGAPFPERARAAIYRELAAIVRERLPETRVSLCLESPRVWDALRGIVPPRARGHFVCNCGPRSSPEAVRLVQLGRRSA